MRGHAIAGYITNIDQVCVPQLKTGVHVWTPLMYPANVDLYNGRNPATSLSALRG